MVEFSEESRKENPNQLPLSVSFRVFRGYAFVMIFLAVVIVGFRQQLLDPLDLGCRRARRRTWPGDSRGFARVGPTHRCAFRIRAGGIYLRARSEVTV